MKCLLRRCLSIPYLSVWLALAGCDSQPTATTVAPPAPVAAATRAAPTAPLPDTTDYTCPRQGSFTYHATVDTLIQLSHRHYWLQLRQMADSTKPIDYGPAGLVGGAFAAPADSSGQHQRVRGYDGTYSFVLRDSTHRRVIFRQQLHKKDLRTAGPAEIVTVSDPEFYYLGYSPGLDALLFRVDTGIPSSDVGHRAALLLDARNGRVLALHDIGSASFGATDCVPQVSPTGQAVLTCADELLRAGQPPLRLRRPHAELRATYFLTDTTLLAVYAFGDYRPTPPEPSESPTDDPRLSAGFSLPDEFISTPAQARADNAFILGISGRVLGHFYFTNWGSGEMEYSLPRQFLAATRTYYFVNNRQELILLPKATPGRIVRLPLKGLPKFQPPQHPQEVKFTLPGDNGIEEFVFYVDTLHPQAVRYRLRNQH